MSERTKITMPPSTIEREAKVKKLIETMADFMGVGGSEVTFESVTISQVELPDEAKDLAMMVRKLAGSKPANGKGK